MLSLFNKLGRKTDLNASFSNLSSPRAQKYTDTWFNPDFFSQNEEESKAFDPEIAAKAQW
jgi:hypothetical protein